MNLEGYINPAQSYIIKIIINLNIARKDRKKLNKMNKKLTQQI
jgi:hypothetical protein